MVVLARVVAWDGGGDVDACLVGTCFDISSCSFLSLSLFSRSSRSFFSFSSRSLFSFSSRSLCALASCSRLLLIGEAGLAAAVVVGAALLVPVETGGEVLETGFAELPEEFISWARFAASSFSRCWLRSLASSAFCCQGARAGCADDGV